MKRRNFLLRLAGLILGASPAFAQFFPIATGAIPFGDSRRNLRADSTNLLWDNTNKQITLGNGTSSNPSFSFVGSNVGNGMYLSDNNRLNFATNGSSRASIAPTGEWTVPSTTDATSTVTGSFTTSGGLGVAKAAYVGTTLSAVTAVVTATTDATSATTGALTVVGGAGVAKSLYVGADAFFGATAAATSPARVHIDRTGYTTGSNNISMLNSAGSDSLNLGVTGTATPFVQFSTINWLNTLTNQAYIYAPSPGLIIGTGSAAVNYMQFSTTGLLVGATTAATSNSTGALISNGGLGVAGAGYFGSTLSTTGVKVSEGANAKQGAITLSGTSTLISNTSVTSTSRLYLTGVGTTNVAPWLIGVSSGVGFSVGATGAGSAHFLMHEVGP